MKILLISANTLCEPFPVYPLALDYVAGALKPEHDVRLLDLVDKDIKAALREEISSFRPDCIGLSLRNIDNSDVINSVSFIDHYKEIVRIIRAETSAALILGGAGFTIFPERLLSELGADYGIAGEGERLPALVEALEKGMSPKGIPGVIMPMPESSNPRIEAWTGKVKRLMPGETSSASFYINTGGMLNLQTKRGCPYNCIYCTYPLIEGHRIRYSEPKEVASVASGLKALGARFIYIADSVFNSDEKHCLDIADEFIKIGLNVPWGAFFSPLRPSPGFYQKLKEAGLSHVEFGTESLSREMLEAYQKPFKVQDILDAHRSALDAGLHIAHYFMLGGPGETRDTLRQTLETADRLDKAALFFFCGIRIYPGTMLFSIAVNEGMISEDSDLLEPVFYNSEYIPTEDIEKILERHSEGRRNWIMGGGSEKMNRAMARLYSRGRTGPLWEKLIP